MELYLEGPSKYNSTDKDRLKIKCLKGILLFNFIYGIIKEYNGNNYIIYYIQ